MAVAISPIELLAPASTCQLEFGEISCHATSCARQLHNACVASPLTAVADSHIVQPHGVPPQSCPESVASTAPEASVAPTFKDSDSGAVPLSPQQLADFVKDGYLVLWPNVPGGEDFHRNVCAEAARRVKEGDLGNNCIADETAKTGLLDPLLAAPELVGALTTLLGEDYALMPHRHCHVSRPDDQQLHQDDWFGYDNCRQMVPLELMVFYYPQTVTSQMGPTAVIPGSQYSRRSGELGQWVPGGAQHSERLLTLDQPGGCMLMSWHTWHRATARTGGKSFPERYAFKLQFRRCRPLEPPPAIVCSLRSLPCPFLFQDDHDGEELVRSDGPEMSLKLACSCVWAALVGTPLPPRIAAAALERCRDNSAGAYRYAALAVASRVWPATEAFEELASVIRDGGDTDASNVGSLAPSACGTPSRSASVSPPGSPIGQSPTVVSEEASSMMPPEAPAPPQLPSQCSLRKPQVAMLVTPREVGGTEMLAEAAAAIQLLSPSLLTREMREKLGNVILYAVTESLGVVTPSNDGSSSPPPTYPAARVDPWRIDWRLEAIQAVGGLLPPEILLPTVLPLIQPSQSNRVQYRALLGLIDAGVRCGGSDCAEWRAAAEATQLEEHLLACVEHWQNYGPVYCARMQQRPCMDFLGRYILAEALRCIGLFCLPSGAERAAHLIGVGDNAELYSNIGWRKRFLAFLETRRRCPITTPGSPF